MALPALSTDELHVFVFGPGTGELIAVRAPPDHWMLVDGCGTGRTKYGLALLEHYRAAPHLIALTHPHTDHAVGVADVIDTYTAGPPTSWPKLGLLWPTPRDRISALDVQAYFRGGIVEDALNTIRDRWRRSPACRWNLDVGTSTPLGDARVTVLSPESGPRKEALKSWAAGSRYDPNKIASALEVSWRGHHLVLGSDLVEQPGGAWTSAARRCSATLLATKIPHHGSTNALHTCWIQGTDGGPTLACTPFASSNLPRFDSTGGIARMLQTVDHVCLTALPRAYAQQGGAAGQRITRRQLEKLNDAELDPPVPGWPDCYVLLSISADGSARVTHGPGSIQVAERPRRGPRRRIVAPSRRPPP